MKAIGGVLLLGLVIGGIYLLTRDKKSVSHASNIRIWKPGNSEGLVRYKNKEIREIEWDYEHMVPTRMTIIRESLQLP